MEPHDIIHYLDIHHVPFIIRNGEFRFNGKHPAITEEIRSSIIEHRPELANIVEPVSDRICHWCQGILAFEDTGILYNDGSFLRFHKYCNNLAVPIPSEYHPTEDKDTCILCLTEKAVWPKEEGKEILCMSCYTKGIQR